MWIWTSNLLMSKLGDLIYKYKKKRMGKGGKGTWLVLSFGSNRMKKKVKKKKERKGRGLLLGIVEEKVYCRYFREHRQRQRHL